MQPANICLMMIVKNEMATLPTLLESVRPLISQWLIIDTGSTDGTQDLIRRELAYLPGQLIERPWVSFGHNRSELVSMIPSSADFAFLLDADQQVQVSSTERFFAEIAEHPDVDAFQVAVDEMDFEYRMPYLVRRGAKFRYEGATHEYLTAETKLKVTPVNSFRIKHVGNGGSKADKFERDRVVLENEIRLGKNLVRSHFYLAQTLEGLYEPEKARMHYAWVAANSNWDEERYVAHLRSGKIRRKQGRNQDALEALYQAMDQCPDRVEAIFEIVKILQEQKHFAAAKVFAESATAPNDSRILFVESWLSQWGMKVELGVINWNLGRVAEAKALFNEVLALPDLHPDTIELVNKNLSFC